MSEGAADSGDDSGGRGGRERVVRALRDLLADRADESSYETLYRHFTPRLERQFVRWGASSEEARDLNQETFQRIYRDVEGFRGSERLFESWVGWVWKIARTTWLQSLRYRRAGKRPQNPQPLEKVDEERLAAAARPPRQLERVLSREVEDTVRRAIESLPERQLECVILYYYQELKTREISVLLKIAPGTVKAHLHQARAQLAARLGESFVPGALKRESEPGGAHV